MSKQCVFCRHRRADYCNRPEPVTGLRFADDLYVSKKVCNERKQHWFKDTCGPEGKYFEEKVKKAEEWTIKEKGLL